MERRLGARARYRADHEAAAKTIISYVSRVSRIEGDGEFTFTYNSPLLRTTPALEIQLIPEDFTGYPNDHFFLAFTSSQDAPPCVAKTLEDFVSESYGLKVKDAVTFLAERLTASLDRDSNSRLAESDEAPDVPMTSEESPSPGTDDEDEEFGDIDWINDSDEDIFDLTTTNVHLTPGASEHVVLHGGVSNRIRKDFRAVREGGFLISKLVGFDLHTRDNIVSISARVDKLCLSEENLSAWNLQATDFLVLLIKYQGYYTTFEQALSNPTTMPPIDFRLRKCSQYKPTLEQAYQAFSVLNYSLDSSTTQSCSGKAPEISLLSVGGSIDILMKEEFIRLLRLRCEQNLTWDGAKKILARSKNGSHVKQKDTPTNIMPTETNTDLMEDEDHNKLPAFIAKENVKSDSEASLPLIAAQFAMRHFIRSTDYCMVCFEKVGVNFEALKPYVCSNPLCLFQYMNMGLGPSIDIEVLKHPNVVDLLISFCWAALNQDQSNRRNQFDAARSSTTFRGCLREYPDGLNLLVPKIISEQYEMSGSRREVKLEDTNMKLIDPISGNYNSQTSTMTLDEAADMDQVRLGEWVAIVVPTSGKSIVRHGCIETAESRDVVIKVHAEHTLPISSCQSSSGIPAANPPSLPAFLLSYNQSVDDLEFIADKAKSLMLLLATTPSIGEMRGYLRQSPKNRLEKWDRMNPSVSRLVRWIVASNRSSIVQVDNVAIVGDDREDAASLARPSERISGVDGMIQFRFAQGSPEKEVSFDKELKTVIKPQKTILGWHGSNLVNWHSIIRNGLDFKVIANGRAHGNGVYFARHFDYSASYASAARVQHHAISSSTMYSTASAWPNSKLQIQSAMSLNEIVNKPSEFVTRDAGGGIYVVDKEHWIQCRYLFVKPGNHVLESRTTRQDQTSTPFLQDAAYTALGPNNLGISVPIKAIPSAHINLLKANYTLTKQNALGHTMTHGEGDEEEDPEDIEFLFKDSTSDGRDHNGLAAPKDAASLLSVDKTDFRPGTLDLSSLPQLSPPGYATPLGQKTIGQEIKKLQHLQATTPVHELGWYIDFDQISNMFHWIVELHSFDPELPLAKDMKKANVTSIVLEIRFGREFPMSPPFLRVIRPRFLPFQSGGGGHVTIGGAMCMQLLTTSGWSPANSMESVLLQVRLALLSDDPRPAKLALTKAMGVGKDYGISEAYDAFTRAASAHGWEVPKDLQETTTAMMWNLNL
ncbi:hypothetical protein PFICI_08947 [Pestalotiopsis fici W106-1]|uniref:UBC core domain-containing protein n=1 Tax=Pestalotiopsis fici (strain W106-1 / CGMCC3.15140) TaxID=1229662 RepID=W3WZ84_PESFW|nr:uncharacterized protein PFICI_08947 [Pestalotiopsis fici W106-1]ETS79094.1 hypothetical protein PFICI_08947 [Pestalotiopsis fici W106-1]